MNFSAIKEKLGIVGGLDLRYSRNEDGTRWADESGVPSPWLSTMNNDSRVRISVHEDTVKVIQASPDLSNFGIKTESKVGAKGAYTQHYIVKYSDDTPVDVSL